MKPYYVPSSPSSLETSCHLDNLGDLQLPRRLASCVERSESLTTHVSGNHGEHEKGQCGCAAATCHHFGVFFNTKGIVGGSETCMTFILRQHSCGLYSTGDLEAAVTSPRQDCPSALRLLLGAAALYQGDAKQWFLSACADDATVG